MTIREMDEVLRALDRQIRDPQLHLERLASQMNVSASYLSRLIKKMTGRGFLAHVRVRRVAIARAMLLQSRLSIKEIAAAVGYSSVTQLGRHFRRATGVPPSAIRLINARRAASTDQIDEP